MTINERKKELRKQVRLLKQKYSLFQMKEMSKDILEQLEQHERFIKAQVIMMYWSMDDEVYTHEFIKKWANKKRMILPVVNGNELNLKEFISLEEMIAGDKFGILEPNGNVLVEPKEIDLIIVPGVAFDVRGNRMGRGKAYYDKLLSISHAFKLGICFSFQVFNEVPFDQLDVKMDDVLFNSHDAI